ncbi:MAG: metalloprotease TldD, partial [Thiobacillus sp.]|nr:metalloprotease TldD [Thiobacillus sp.]
MNPTDAFVPIQTAEQLFRSAEAMLLTPNGLDADKLAPVFGRLLTHDVDYADLYFQYSRSEGWSLEEGQVKSGSFNIDQGVGVRAISGEKTAFAYSDDISLDALGAAADATRAIARAGQARQTAVARRADGRQLYHAVDPLASLDDAAKVTLLERLEKKARAMDPRVIQVMASLASEYEVIYVARS